MSASLSAARPPRAGSRDELAGGPPLLGDPPAARVGRVGIVVPKHKRSSVERNRLKRRLRELARTLLLPGLPAVDVVVRTFPESYDVPFAALEGEVRKVGERLRRLYPSGGGA